MAYEVRINREILGVYATTEEAQERVREAMKGRPADCEVEMIDTTTGRAAEPAASIGARDDLANKIGF
jgi:hypothetical protein